MKAMAMERGAGAECGPITQGQEADTLKGLDTEMEKDMASDSEMAKEKRNATGMETEAAGLKGNEEMKPESEERAMNKLWQHQLLVWDLEASMVDDQFRKDCRKVCEAGMVLRVYAKEYSGTPSAWNIVHDVLKKTPSQWKGTWCKPDNWKRWEEMK